MRQSKALGDRGAAWRCVAVTTRRRERPLHPIRNFPSGSGPVVGEWQLQGHES